MSSTAFRTDLFDEMSLDRAVSRSSDLKSVLSDTTNPDDANMKGVATDIWSMLYKQRPRHTFDVGLEINHAVIRKLDKSSEFRQLREQTRHDVIASAHALENFSRDLKKWARLLDASKIPDLSDDIHKDIHGELNDDESDALDEKMNEILDVDDLLEIMERTAERTNDELAKVYAFAGGAGFSIRDMANGPNGDEAWKLFNVLKNNSKLNKLMDIAGRLIRLSSASKKMKINPGNAEVYDIENSNDLARVMASEFIYLADPELEDLFFLKFAEAGLQSYELQSSEPVGKGPVVVCVDSSSSMRYGFGKASQSTTKIDWAKAVALSLLIKCKKEKRDIHIIFFNSSVAAQFTFKKGDVSADELARFAAFSAYGGTSFEPALNMAIKKIGHQKEFKKADVVFLSDGEAKLADYYVKDFNEKKEEMNFSVMSGCIGYAPGKTITSFSDSVHTIGGDNADDFVMKVL